MILQTDKPKESVSIDLISPVKRKATVDSDDGDDVRTGFNVGADDNSSTASDDTLSKQQPSRVSRVVISK